MVAGERQGEHRAARVDECGRYRCWRCGAVLADGTVGAGTALNLNCKCDSSIRNRLVAPANRRST